MKTKRNYNIYSRKRAWKLILVAFALLIIGVSLWYSNVLVHKIAQDERQKIHTWATAIGHRAELVNSTQKFFTQIQDEERKRVKLWAEAIHRLNQNTNEDVSFYLDIIENNTNIPVLLTDNAGKVLATRNLPPEMDTLHTLKPSQALKFSKYPPIKVPVYKDVQYIYYQDSKVFTNMQVVLNNLVHSFFSEVVNNSASVPVIITDSTHTRAIAYGHVDTVRIHDGSFVSNMASNMATENTPIEIMIAGQGKQYIYYKDSYVLTQLRYFPYIQFAIIGIFLFIAYLLFSTARRSEQNQVWAGLAKETAHQLGTPLSSMMAWVDYLETKQVGDETITELRKDVNRLQTITERFSKIGSKPSLTMHDVGLSLQQSVEYLKTRTSRKIVYHLLLPDQAVMAPLNQPLFEWVIENVVKNAADAMAGKGQLTIELSQDPHFVYIDVSDTGKGIARKMFKVIFNPGFTSKQRGWGLGLSLSKRIINEYHHGKIFVKASTLGKGSTFRIQLNKTLVDG